MDEGAGLTSVMNFSLSAKALAEPCIVVESYVIVEPVDRGWRRISPLMEDDRRQWVVIEKEG